MFLTLLAGPKEERQERLPRQITKFVLTSNRYHAIYTGYLEGHRYVYARKSKQELSVVVHQVSLGHCDLSLFP